MLHIPLLGMFQVGAAAMLDVPLDIAINTPPLPAGGVINPVLTVEGAVHTTVDIPVPDTAITTLPIPASVVSAPVIVPTWSVPCPADPPVEQPGKSR